MKSLPKSNKKFRKIGVLKFYKIHLITVVMHKEKEENGILSHIHTHDGYRSREIGAFELSLLDGDMFLQVSMLLNRQKRKKTKNLFNLTFCFI